MPTLTIACPECHRALTLPGEVTNRLVQCPACKATFHPAGAEAPAVRLPPRPDSSSRRDPPPIPRGVERPPGPKGKAAGDLPPPRQRRKQREEFDICPKCDARMPRGAERCPECGVEFEPEADDRPWERSGAERRDSEPGRGGTILFLGIASIVLPFLFCIPYFGLFTSLVGLVMGACAWIMGHNDLRKINDHIMAREARGSTYGGMVCGIVGTILCFAGVSIGGWITSQVM